MRQRPQSVGVEGFDGPDAGQIQRLDVGQCLAHDDPPSLNEPGGTRVLLEHVRRREGGLVFERLHAALGNPTDVDFDPLARVEPLRGGARQEVAQPGRHAAVGHDGRAALLRESVQIQRVFRHERDIAVRLARFDHGAHRLEPDAAGEGAEDHAVRLNQAPHFSRVGEIRANGLDPSAGAPGGLAQRGVVAVGDHHAVQAFVHQVRCDHAADHAGAQHDAVRHAAFLSRVARPTLAPPRVAGLVR